MKKKTIKIDIIIIVVILLIIAGIIYAVILDKQSEENSEQSAQQTIRLSDYNGKNIAVQTGTNHDILTLNKLPDAKISYFNDYPFQIEAVKLGTMDAFVADNAYLDEYIKEDPSVEYLEDAIDISDVGYAFAKNDEGLKLRGEISKYVTTLIQTGRLQEMYDMWFGDDESLKIPFETKDLDNTNGTIKLAAEFNYAPLIYMKDGKYAGYELYIIYSYCRENGYGLEIFDMAFDGLIPAIQSGVCDIAAAGIEITPEREESVCFSVPHYNIKTVLGYVKGNSVVHSVTPSDYNGKKIGIVTGSSFEPVTLEKFPDSEHLYYNNMSDIAAALSEGKIDGFVGDEPQMRMLCKEQPDLTYLRQTLLSDDYAFGFRKDDSRADTIRAQFDEMLSEYKADGTLNEICEKWFGDDESAKVVDLTGFSGENGKLRVVTTSTDMPFSYIKDDKHVGISIELTERFCRKYGYTPVIEDVDLAARITGISSGLYDMCASSLAITEERKESISFSEPFYNSGMVLTVRASDLGIGSGAVEDRPFSYYAENKKIGAITGGLYEVMIRERYPNAEILQYNNQPDMAVALGSGIIDAFTCPESSAKDFIKADPSLTYLNEVFTKIPYGFAFEKSADKEYLRDQMNEFLQKLHSDGTYDELVSKWFGEDESKKTVDMSGLTGGNGTIRYITAPTMQPFSYVANGENAGFEVELVARFCREYGYSLTIDSAEFASLIPGITSGMYDIASGTIMITDERAESVNFSDVYYTANAVAVVRREQDAEAAAPGFFDSIVTSFEKNFIREDRWKLIVEGIVTTSIITVLSAIFGTVLAFLICMFRRTGSRLANTISNIYVKLLQGTPMVVLLMILYYVILGKSGLSAVWVAIIGFSLNFGAYASEIMRSGIESIDGGQREAALALGYSETQTFFRFIFPQAAARFLPVYKQEIVSLLKSTSIVGYIAIQDLTKMGDIIRSRTYEAFFPLIATAVIYFILAWILSLILTIVMKLFRPARKKKAAK